MDVYQKVQEKDDEMKKLKDRVQQLENQLKQEQGRMPNPMNVEDDDNLSLDAQYPDDGSQGTPTPDHRSPPSCLTGGI